MNSPKVSSFSKQSTFLTYVPILLCKIQTLSFPDLAGPWKAISKFSQ